MYNDYKQIRKNILNGKDLQSNINALHIELSNIYYIISSIKLLMNSYLIEEILVDEDLPNRSARECIEKMYHLIFSDNKLEKGEIESLRNRTIHEVEKISKYSDIFELYHCVLEKTAYGFINEDNIKDFDDDEEARNLLRMIFASEDNLIINTNIQKAVEELPIRMTRNKYYDIVRESLFAFKGAYKESFDRFIYIIRSISMIEDDFNWNDDYKSIGEVYEQLITLDYKRITEEQLELISADVEDSIAYLNGQASLFILIVEIINALYSKFLTEQYLGSSINNRVNEEIEKIKEIFIKFINADDKTSVINEEVLDSLVGVQESFSEELQILETTLFDLSHLDHESIMVSDFDKENEAMFMVQKLLSNNYFMNLNKEDEEIVITEEELKAEVQKFIDDSDSLFKRLDKKVMRIIMGKVMGSLPVFFNSHNEVMEYVRNSFKSCNDIAEKRAAKAAIEMFINY